MNRSIKFRYVNEITGTFVIIVLIALIVAVVLAGKAQRWFEPEYAVTLLFPPEGSLDIQKGAEIKILGTVVGVVKRINVDDEGKMTGNITVRGEFFRFIREDSEAIVKKKFGIAGDAYVEITKGNGAPMSKENTVLQCRKDTEIIETLEEVVEQVRTATLPAIEQLQLAVEEYTKLAASLNDPSGNLQQLLGNLNDMTISINKGDGAVGKVLKDPEFAEEVGNITKEINASLVELQTILKDVEKTTQSLPGAMDKVNGELEELPGTVYQAKATLKETEALIEALQKHWLIKKYMADTGGETHIPSSSIYVPMGGGQ